MIGAVAELSASQWRTRERVESLIGLMAPALDLVLVAGDRLSRLVEPEDYDYYPARPLADTPPVSEAPRGKSSDLGPSTR
jgi:hypothetical protein